MDTKIIANPETFPTSNAPHVRYVHLYFSKGKRSYSKTGIRTGHFTTLGNNTQKKYYFGARRSALETLFLMVKEETELFGDCIFSYQWDSRNFIAQWDDVEAISQMTQRLSSLVIDDPMIGVEVNLKSNPNTNSPELGSVVGTIIGPGGPKKINVEFGTGINKDQALISFLAYKREGATPPTVHYCHKKQKLIRFDNPQCYKQYVDLHNPKPLSVRMVAGCLTKGGMMYHTSCQKPMGNFYYGKKRFGFGKRRTINEAFDNVLNHVKKLNFEMVEFKFDGFTKYFEPSKRSHKSILLKLYKEQLRLRLSACSPDFNWCENVKPTRAGTAKPAVKLPKLVNKPTLSIEVGIFRLGKKQYYSKRKDPMGVVCIKRKRIPFGATHSLSDALKLVFAHARNGDIMEVEYNEGSQLRTLDLSNDKQCERVIKIMRGMLRSELERLATST